MKNTVRALALLLVLITTLAVTASASGESTNVYTYTVEDTEYTVIFSGSSIPQEKQETIAQRLIGADDSSAQTYGLGCTLFGHDYLYDTVYVIKHKAKSLSPRCERMTYNITYCEDCDYFEETPVSSRYIVCCPED